MKRILVFLMAMLLLTGCAAGENVEETQAATVAEVAKPGNLYVENSPMEQQTDGAVKAYHLEESCIDIATMDGNVVLVTDLSKLILMDAETGEVGTAVKVGESISCATADFTASEKGITYYRQEGRELVFLSNALRQEQTVEIPEGIVGYPCISRVNEEVYYCKDNAIYAQHLQSGQIRKVFGSEQPIALCAGHLDGTILECIVTDSQGVEKMLYLDAVSGEALKAFDSLLSFRSEGERYLLERKDGILAQTIYSALNGENSTINVDQPITLLPQMNGGYHYTLEEGALEIVFYDFLSGARKQIRLENVTEEPASITADARYIWMLVDGQLLRWDVFVTNNSENESFLAPLYTRENPDVSGLEQCAQRAQALTEQYGIYISVGEEAVAVNGGYELISEYQAPVLNQMMDALEEVLQQLPEDLLEQSLWDGDIHICFVRSIGGREVAQFYKESESYILVSAAEQPRLNILRGFGYIIDGHVLNYSWAYDDWDWVNPEGFSYDYTDYFYDTHENSVYLTDENRAFVDAYAMTFPHEDRSLLFAYAVMDGNARYFTTQIMQEKLSLLCEGIRDAYGYWWVEEPFLWEQYLTEE